VVDVAVADRGFTARAGARVLLRRFGRADAAALARYRTVPEVARYQSWGAPYPLAAAEQLIGQLMREHPDTPGQWYQFAVTLRSTGELIGDCGALPLAADPRIAEIGFTTAPGHQGHGYGTEAVLLLLGYLFSERHKHRVSATCDARNTASARLLERVGMQREGHLRESTWAKGEWTDDLLFGMLDREWREQAGAAPSGPAHPADR
jgi:RimJ/RimL family protein N-acetyltransferase